MAYYLLGPLRRSRTTTRTVRLVICKGDIVTGSWMEFSLFYGPLARTGEKEKKTHASVLDEFGGCYNERDIVKNVERTA